MTNTAIKHDSHLAVRALWGLYLGILALVAGCFVGLVITGGSAAFLAAGLLGCVCAWMVADPLDKARSDARVRARGRS
jgi:asparagine N-glycosylation enzyme membrane subunit Stt3